MEVSIRMNPRKTNEYYPYICKEDAQAEYNSLRTEIHESQKQRVTLLTGSLAFIGALFSYLVKDGTLLVHEATFLILLTVPSSLYAYSTRIRERRIATYISVFIPAISFWSHASAVATKPRLRFFQRSSTAMILSLIILDIILLMLPFKIGPCKFGSFDWFLIVFSGFLVIVNIIVLWHTAKLRSFTLDFKRLLQKKADKLHREMNPKRGKS
jgi:hypothetical protein